MILKDYFDSFKQNTLRLARHLPESLERAFSSLQFSSGDLTYKRSFVRRYVPDLFDRHNVQKYTNCAFCVHLVRSACHKYCLKCSLGVYVQPSPLLPGILSCEDRSGQPHAGTAIPWYFRKTCYNFERLPAYRYLRNFNVFMSSITIYNYEVLEGLLEGLSSNEKPCFICASTDYDIYKKCSLQRGFDMSTPCSRINSEIASRYSKTG